MRIHVGYWCAVVALLLAPPAIAQIADAEGDADIPCVDITSLDVRGDTQDLTVTLQTSMRPYPPQYRVKGIDVNDLRLCPDGQYEFLIDTNGDGAEDVTLVTFVDRKGHAHTSGADGLQADVDVDAGRIVWTVPNDSLGLADYPANVSIIAQTGIIPSRAQPKLIRRLDTSDDAPTEWTEFMVGADASAILGVAGGELWVSDPASPLDGARLWIPAGALGKATSICFNDVSEAPDLPPGVEFMGPPVKLSPEGLHLERAAVIRLPHLGGGASPAGILLHDFDDSGRFRETLPLLFIDRQSVMATISHFSQVGPARADVRLLSSPSKLIALASPHSYTMTADFLRCAQLADHGVSLYVPNAGGLRPDGTFFAASTVPALASSIGALLTDNPDAAVRLWFNGCQDLRDENGDGINEILKVPCDWLDGFEVAAAAEVVGQARLVADQVFQELAPRGWTLAQIEERIGLFLDIEPSSDTDLIPPAGYVNLLRAIPDEETVAVFAMKLGSNDDNDEAWSWTESTMVQISTAADEVLYGAYDYGQQILVGDSWWERWLAGLRWGCWTSEDCYATRVASDLQRMIKLELGDKTALLLSSMYYGNAHSFAESVKSGVAGLSRVREANTLRGVGLYEVEGPAPYFPYPADGQNPVSVEMCSDAVLVEGPLFPDAVTYTACGGGNPTEGISGEWAMVRSAFDRAPSTWDCRPEAPRRYEIVRADDIGWTAARDECVSRGGHLATIGSAAENAEIAPLVTDFNVWIGGYQDRSDPQYSEPSGGWRWVTGEPWVYTNWHAGEPNNLGWNEEYLEMYPYEGMKGEWNDNQERDPRHVDGYACEFGVGPVVLLSRPGDSVGEYFRGLLTANHVVFQELSPDAATASDLSGSFIIAAFASEPTEFYPAAQNIADAVSNGAWIIAESWGAYLLSRAGVGTTWIQGWGPAVRDTYAFVKPFTDSPVFEGLTTWDPPHPSEEAARLDEQLRLRVEHGGVALSAVKYSPPANEVSNLSFWELIVTYGWAGQRPDSDYCRQWGGCTPERDVDLDVVTMVEHGQGRIFRDVDVAHAPGQFIWAPVQQKIHVNEINWFLSTH